ncbi:membrane-spanning 4-domains subfamily A member 18-like [Colossoma macropomum]|uniref:membrane-spanning 4-domains subfamily A member 18-like n=1 Tax=Colossoma macropomum TaxID=42526 RepID=UPI0018652F5E|nr:membrane-spanning 4-domains subfamily A member 18-like [Colossoma macropomum]
MAASVVSVEHARNGFTIVTHVVPGGTEQYGPGTGAGVYTGGPLKKLLNREPKALGTVQIMIGIMTLLFGIVSVIYFESVSVFSGVTFWGSCSYIASGALCIVSINQTHPCVVKGSLVMNVFSAVSAGVAMILLSFDLSGPLDFPRCYNDNPYREGNLCAVSAMFLGVSRGVSGVLLVFSVLEFFISICTSAFICKASCCTDIMILYRFVFRMASSFVPVENTRNGFTIVTQVVPAGMDQYGPGTGVFTLSPVKKLLKGEPKALGTVQIMIGIMTFLFGIVKTVHLPSLSIISGVTYWGSCLYITSGSLSVAAGNKADTCVVIGSLVMNIISAVAAGVAIILLSIDISIRLFHPYYYSCLYEYSSRDSEICKVITWVWGQSKGISGVLLVFSLLEFIISICTSAFAYKATCCAESPAQAMIYLNNPESNNLAENV